MCHIYFSVWKAETVFQDGGYSTENRREVKTLYKCLLMICVLSLAVCLG